MSEFQTLMALVVLIFVLSVIVQAVQEILKSLLHTKAQTMTETLEKFMGSALSLPQVKGALQARGLDITALEHFDREDFRHLLDGVEGLEPQLQGVVASATATFEQKKENVAAAYEAAWASFQRAYTAKNKKWAVALSFVVVLALNASLIRLYEVLLVNQTMSQAIAGTASTVLGANQAQNGGTASQPPDLATVYAKNRDAITQDLRQYPILLRTLEYPKDLSEDPFGDIAGLLVMGLLVSLGAPFWNDVLKGVMGVNHALNTGRKKTS
jgi:hypothetical protein